MTSKASGGRTEIEVFVKKWGWTVAMALLFGIALWEGLTLRREVQSWRLLNSESGSLQRKADFLLSVPESAKKGSSLPGEKGEDAGKQGVQPKRDTSGAKETPTPDPRAVEATFFYRPKSTYTLTAILSDYAVVNGKEVRVGDRIEKGVVKEIEPGFVSILDDGTKDPKKIDLHPGS